MKLYKYRSLANFEFTADILINKRLYAAHFKDLNDPMEGDFSPDDDVEYNKQVEAAIDSIRICSLSSDFTNPILWAHYADGYKGICIEIEIDESKLKANEVNYGPFNPIPSPNHRGVHGDETVYTPHDWAEVCLRGKYEEWKYENEYRLFSNTEFIDSGFQITSVLLGVRIPEIYENILSRIISNDIEIKRTEIDPLNGVRAIIV